jgi:hypothetical protein
MDIDGAMCTRWRLVALITGLLLLGLIEPSSSRGNVPDPDLWPCASKNPSWVEDESTKAALSPSSFFQNLAAALKDRSASFFSFGWWLGLVCSERKVLLAGG